MNYTVKCIRIYWWNLLQWLNRHLLITYPLIEDCARCRDCGRNVHDFHVPDNLWLLVIPNSDGVWCYDCFCDRADRMMGQKWRLELTEVWYCQKISGDYEVI